MAGRYDDAIKWARGQCGCGPGYLGAHRMLCASLAQAGLLEEAKAAMSTLQHLQPDLSIAWVKLSVPYTSRPMALSR